jgi:hypothetical protein
VNRRRFLAAAALSGIALRAQESPSPQALYQKVIGNPNLKKFPKGENFCWHAAYDLGRFVEGYRAFGDTAWLDAGLRFSEFLVGNLDAGPDGYLGWIGPYEYDESVWCDVHVGDAILFDGLLGFAEVVLADSKLSSRYGEPARKYVALARRNLFEKWDARGTWITDGPYGAYRSWNRYGVPGNLKDWPVRDDIRNSNLALPFNKQEDVGAVALKLYRITGEAQFRERAFRIFAFHKSRLNLIDDRYVWNYWEPAGAADIDFTAGRTRHWVNVHPDRPYQAGEVAHIADAYHTGVVFDEQDIRRILITNLRVMWNGSFDAPEYRNSNGNATQKAGALWTSLADFDGTVRKLHEAGLAKSNGIEARIARATLEKLPAPSFERRHLKGQAAVFDFPLSSCPDFNMAAAMESGALLACSAPNRGAIEIAHYSADGKHKIAVLKEFNRGGQIFHRWTLPKERCRVRFTFDQSSYREVLVG